MELQEEPHFLEVVQIIEQSRAKALKTVNTELITLYWKIGEYIHLKLTPSSWGDAVIDQLSTFIQSRAPELKGFSSRNLRRMKQFYENYLEFTKWSPLVTKLSWTNNLVILSRTKTTEEQEFYLKLTIQEGLSRRDLERQINTGFFERVMIGNESVSHIIKETHQSITNNFKDTYIFEFLNLSEGHSERELQQGLINQMKKFILELGNDFLYFGEQFKVQVGASDFFIDLLFYHRGLQCLVAFELKADKFKPEHLGKINFYLEALDRNVKKTYENPSIGILLCKDKDNEVVEYTLSRSLSPTLVAEYQTKLPDKKLLQQKLHDIFEDFNKEKEE